MYLEIFPADFAVFRVFLGISRDFAEIPEFRGSVTARNIRSPVNRIKFNYCRRHSMGQAVVINIPPKCDRKTQLSKDIFRNILKITQILLDSILY